MPKKKEILAKLKLLRDSHKAHLEVYTKCKADYKARVKELLDVGLIGSAVVSGEHVHAYQGRTLVTTHIIQDLDEVLKWMEEDDAKEKI